MFALGDKAVYPAHGVGVIERIESRKVSDQEEHFYVIRIIDTGMTVMVPRSKANEVGLRHVISKDKAEEVFKVFRKKEEIKSTRVLPWNRRQRDYMAKLKSGSILDLAEILKELTYIQSHKPLSFGEKKLLETVRRLLIKELACCHNCSEDVVWGKINSLLSS
ncbi:MAG: CarD family transcriptional regulator [bacterium]